MIQKTLAMLALSLACTFTFAQQAVKFKIQYLPNHQYNIKNTTVIDMTMDMKGDTALLAKAKQGGLTLPMVMKNSQNMEGTITTGAFSADKSGFPLQMTFGNTLMRQSVNGKDTPLGPNPLNGLTIAGNYTNGKMVLDTTSTDTKMAQIKAIAAKTMTAILGAMKFPETPMKVGETFDQTAAMPLPLPGITMGFNVKTSYKLISISNGIANFDMIITMTFNMDGETKGDVPMNVNGSGSGNGKLQYDIANSFTKSLQQTLTMNYSMPIKTAPLTISGNAAISTTYEALITKKP